MREKASILLVDDDRDILFATSRLLKSAGYHVREASTAEECREALKSYRPDLLLLDVVLPDADGRVLCSELKADPALEGIFIVLLSGTKTSSDEQAEGLDMGAEAYITRPIANREFLARIHAMDRIRRMEERLRESQDILEKRVAERTARIRRLSGRILEAQEHERRKIGLELHDSVGQLLTTAKFAAEKALDQLQQGAADDCATSLESIISYVQQASDEARRIHTELRPPLLDDLGIVMTISWFCREFQELHSGLRIDMAVDVEEQDIPEPLKIVIFRILQEALNNVAKHSQADQVDISLKKNNKDRVEFVVADNGHGFAKEQMHSNKRSTRSFGLSNMRERTILSGGAFEIRSENESGTTIWCFWPAG